MVPYTSNATDPDRDSAQEVTLGHRGCARPSRDRLPSLCYATSASRRGPRLVGRAPRWHRRRNTRRGRWPHLSQFSNSARTRGFATRRRQRRTSTSCANCRAASRRPRLRRFLGTEVREQPALGSPVARASRPSTTPRSRDVASSNARTRIACRVSSPLLTSSYRTVRAIRQPSRDIERTQVPAAPGGGPVDGEWLWKSTVDAKLPCATSDRSSPWRPREQPAPAGFDEDLARPIR